MLWFVITIQYFSCDGAKYYCYDEKSCYDVGECLQKGYFPYRLGRVCVNSYPDSSSGIERDEHGAYKCPSDKYIIFNETYARCVKSVAECPGFYITHERMACLNNSWICSEYAHMIGYSNTTGLYCISSTECFDTHKGYRYNYANCVTAVECE